MNKTVRRLSTLLIILFAMLLITPHIESVFASTQKYYFDSVVNTGKDTGYSGQNHLEIKDMHYGWKLGSFVVSGYTRVVKDEQENPVFLKNLGDRITLSFRLEQDIDMLNENKNLLISEDSNGFDEYFEVEKTNFGRGTLIVRHTDYQNVHKEPIIFVDYLPALLTGADTVIELLEEGDYEVALNYEVKENYGPFGILSSYNNYRIFFKYSIRNGNCMVYPFDIATMTELLSSSVTEEGFYLDLAKSRYLDIDVRKSVLIEGSDELTDDTRFNMIAKSGDRFTDEGIYTITVRNKYTRDNTEKIIYVGTNSILIAYMRTGYSIREIYEQQEKGAQIMSDGTIVQPPIDSIIHARDIVTGMLLQDKSITENGFYLNLDESQHLGVIIIKEVLTNAADGLTEDTQFNSFAKEGEQYIAEGVYTIITINRSAEIHSSMKICVGTNIVLKAHMNTGYSIREINEKIALGAQITDVGDIIMPTPQALENDMHTNRIPAHSSADMLNEADSSNGKSESVLVPVLIGSIIVVAVVVFIMIYRKRQQLKKDTSLNNDYMKTNGEE